VLTVIKIVILVKDVIKTFSSITFLKQETASSISYLPCYFLSNQCMHVEVLKQIMSFYHVTSQKTSQVLGLFVDSDQEKIPRRHQILVTFCILLLVTYPKPLRVQATHTLAKCCSQLHCIKLLI
jgi:hypothetical protein